MHIALSFKLIFTSHQYYYDAKETTQLLRDSEIHRRVFMYEFVQDGIPRILTRPHTT